jgi:DNA-binding NarL/FixJ family response regulator
MTSGPVDMSAMEEVRVSSLLIEDNSTDMLLMQEALSDVYGVRFAIQNATRLSEALARLEAERFDVVLVDLELPDSSGLETFRVLHEKAPDIPKVVMTGGSNEDTGIQAMQMGAQDYLLKSEARTTLLSRVIRYAIERHRLQSAVAEARDRESYDREIRSIERLSKAPGTSYTAEIYDGRPLCQSAPENFLAAVDRYEAILEQALERRLYKTEDKISDGLREMSQALGFLRASPRDVVEIYSSALNRKVADRNLKAAQLYMDEGRVTVLELMGYLASYYRHYYPGPSKVG